MAPQKVFVTGSNKATFICPECKRSKVVDVDRHRGLDKAVRVKVTCPCGISFIAVMERRRQYRKKTRLPGTLFKIACGRKAGPGVLMTVTDLSRTGMKIKANSLSGFSEGDLILAEFSLDDRKRSFISKELIIRKLSGGELGTEFVSFNPCNAGDKAIGFYLFG